MDAAERLLQTRPTPGDAPADRLTEEGGGGMIGLACSQAVRGEHICEPSRRMHNRGNGRGGGVAAAGLVPEEVGVSRDVLQSHYLLQIALLDESAHAEIERECIVPVFDVAAGRRVETVDDYREIEGLEVKPPDVHRYLVRVKPDVLDAFTEAHGLGDLSPRDREDEYLFRHSFELNQKYYASLDEPRAFVLSRARDLMVFKIVGYAEQAAGYYQLQDTRAHVWIAHQRHPTASRVGHPGGAHPFAGLNEAVAHSGNFANYHSVSEYLLQRNTRPQFHTDTEAAALLLDLWDRVYKYPIEYIVEALAPTTELDFDRLAPEKQRIYRQIQATCAHAAPDGPWSFLIARSRPDESIHQLLGIADCGMLRPLVFALADSGPVQIGLIGSEKQAIDAALGSLAREDPRICPVADKYWTTRGGSHIDGGALVFTVGVGAEGDKMLSCVDKFGRPVALDEGEVRVHQADRPADAPPAHQADEIRRLLHARDVQGLFGYAKTMGGWPAWGVAEFCDLVVRSADNADALAAALDVLTLMHDRRYNIGDKRLSTVLGVIAGALDRLFDSAPLFGESATGLWRRVTWDTRDSLAAPAADEDILVVDGQAFPPEGDDCSAVLLRGAREMGWKRLLVCRLRGQRFHGAGLGAASDGVRLDVYGSSGDYLGSGIDGMEIHCHGHAQDQVAQILRRGKIVIHGDVGHAFMYGAEAGEVYVLGSAAGRSLVNAVGKPRVVINGTCLDFLAEGFMGGDPLVGGGFVILNAVAFDRHGRLVALDQPYPGSNLLSLASGGAVYIRDPHKTVVAQQLNGGEIAELTEKDWRVIRPYLTENERLFGVTIKDLLTVDGQVRPPQEVYRKVHAVKLALLAVLQQEEPD